MKYRFVAWKESGMWTAHSPSVPGVYGVGSTAASAERDLREALVLVASYLTEGRRKMPRPQKLRFGEVRI